MERPEINVDNYQEVYDYYRQVEQPGRILRLAYAAFNGVLHPRITLAEGAQYDLDRIKHESLPHFYIFNHLSRADYFIFASTLHQIARDDIGTIRTMGADFNFRWPQKRIVNGESHLQLGAGPLTDYIGGIPVFRSIEYPDVDLHPVQDELFNCVRDSIVAGQKGAAAPEGKINETDDHVTLLKFRSGVGEVIRRTTDMLDVPAGITPIGFCYKREARERNKATKASVYLGRTLFVPPGSTTRQINDHARGHLQYAATMAHELY